MIWRATLPVTPSGKGRPRWDSRNRRTITPEKTRKATDEIIIHLWRSKPHLFQGPVKVILDCVFTRPKSAPKTRTRPSVKPDIDNIAKLVLDAANKILWVDDTQVVELHVYKTYGSPEGITIEVEEL